MARISSRGLQKFLNGEVHDWYRIVHGYSDQLVAYLLDRFQIRPGRWVVDPFCGTGTTLIECMKRGVNAIGIDANPSSVFAAQVKTNWGLKPSRIVSLLDLLMSARRKYLRRRASHFNDPTFKYLETSGMLERGWISPAPLRRAIALKQGISDLPTTAAYRSFFQLALVAELISSISNVKFGPELYCGPPKDDVDVFGRFQDRVLRMISDLSRVSRLKRGAASVVQADSRCRMALRSVSPKRGFAAAIASPPYPAEHDYTRNARLELAFLELVTNLDELRTFKRMQLRSHSKGIYKGDNDGKAVANVTAVQSLVARISRKSKAMNHGFGRYYPTVVREYFGGMARHLQALLPMLQRGAQCAYVVGDQSAYAGICIPTSRVLEDIAADVGFEVIETIRWRTRRASRTSRTINENILVLRRPSLETVNG